MYINRKLVRAIQNFYQQFRRKSPSTVKEQSLWLLRSFIVTKKRPDWVNAGFVLPTVAMVSLVVVLLTIAILFRSFDRSKNASNVRVNQAVLNAATPAIDRARAKIDRLFGDPRLPRSTPSDFSLDQVISQNINEFTFGDESQLTLFSDIDGDGSLNTSSTRQLADEENLKTAWKYPVDTDNNGKFDSYTLYSINFRNPPQTNGNPTRVRNPLEARTPPMNETNGSNVCDRGNNTSAQLVGSQGWYQRGSVLRRSLFVYTTTVPITDDRNLDQTKYETFKGNKGFAALEYQQDRERRPLTNNAVLYNDDLEISPGGGINLNGRIITNSNLFAARRFNPIRFYLVSSPDSCYFSERNSKIVVGGNVANARISDAADQQAVTVDLFKQINAGETPSTANINSTNKTINLPGGTQIAYNGGAYERRLVRLITAAAALPNASLPTEIKDELQKRVAQGKDSDIEKRALLRSYFRKRTRRVPYAEVNLANTGDDTVVFRKITGGSYTESDVLQGNGDSMRPPDEWVFPFASNGITQAGYANLELKKNGSNKIYLPATKTDFPEPQGEEKSLGDRILVGNNLPQMWWDTTKNKFVSQEEAGQEISGRQWDTGSGTRKRYPQVSELDDLGETGRDQFWEENAALYPKDALDVVGGLRVVTGAGIYLPKGYSGTESAATYTAALGATDKVWSDQMAVPETPPAVPRPSPAVPDSELPYTGTAYLRMRATAVYHFQNSAYDPSKPSTNPQTPIACVSSFYDPTNATTARNINTLPNFPNTTDRMNRGAGGLSNNGIVYGRPTKSKSDYQAVLNYQASLKYPDGRLINKPLKNALLKGSSNLTLSEKSTLDSAICALQIMDGSIGLSTIIPHGAIRETAFLDARQVKAVDRPAIGSATTYDLDVELRQPLEIRATVLDMAMLKNTSIGNTSYNTTEYLLPNSGIIYATRDDALPDLSADPDPNDNDDRVEASANDFVLDPTRRPNGIMLINGQQLNRTNANLNRPEEKGLILVSNLPVYIKGNFNQHQREEFTNTLNATWSNFYSRTQATLDSNFACRTNQFTGCTTGETWRSATVIADAITVLSQGFQEGVRNEGDYNLRDNWGYAPKGYDLNGNGTIETTPISLDERILRIDLDGDGNMTNLNVTAINETLLGVDLNDDGKITDTAVKITEKNIPSILTSRFNGFWDNNFVTSFPWQERSTGFPSDFSGNNINSSYFNNFTTPIQRRASFPEYVMEICRKTTVAACRPNDWSVGYVPALLPTIPSNIDWSYRAINAGATRIQPSYTVDRLGAGTTARPALNPNDRQYPRRIAFLRDATDNLILDRGNPVALGISGNDNPNPTNLAQENAGQVAYYLTNDNNGNLYGYNPGNNRPRLHPRALWFKTRNGGGDNYGWNFPLWVENIAGLQPSPNQPLLIPVLQIHFPFRNTQQSSPTNFLSSDETDIQNQPNNWLQAATTTQTNLVFVQGDTPARPNESNGGLENFVRYLETWANATHQASGSFIQYKRSSYATAPWYPIVANFTNAAQAFSPAGTALGYPQMYRSNINPQVGTNLSRTPFYVQPNTRSWGFDVALLTQLPDLFSQRFTAPPTGNPNEFYREISRDDGWVSTLLCAAEPTNPADYGIAPSTKYGADKKYAIPQDQRPSGCR